MSLFIQYSLNETHSAEYCTSCSPVYPSKYLLKSTRSFFSPPQKQKPAWHHTQIVHSNSWMCPIAEKWIHCKAFGDRQRNNNGAGRVGWPIQKVLFDQSRDIPANTTQDTRTGAITVTNIVRKSTCWWNERCQIDGHVWNWHGKQIVR